ncbi:MAG: ABC transporter ATP-binding protein [Thermodesulfobacteriota bacterium]
MGLLELKKVSKRFGGLTALSEFDLEIHKGEILGLIGPNGSGKTTTFNIITGFLEPDSGNLIFENKNITKLKPHSIAELGIIRTFQLANLFFELSVFNNIMIGFHNSAKLSIIGELLNTPTCRKREKELNRKAIEILKLTGLEPHKDKLARNLSAGWRKTLAIAIALAAGPKLLLLDEPACTLSPSRVDSVMNLILKVRDSGVTIMMIEHNMRSIMDYCDRIVVLNFGKKIAEGPPDQVKQNKDVIRTYLGL